MSFKPLLEREDPVSTHPNSTHSLTLGKILSRPSGEFRQNQQK